MKKFRQFFQEKIILSAVMCILLAVVLVTATYGWYAINNSVKTYGLELATGGIGGIKVAIEPGGEDIMTKGYLDQVEVKGNMAAVIPINLKNFTNVEHGKIAPGVYGKLPFYITALGENVKSYVIKVQLEYETSGASDEQKSQIEEIIRDHIMVYKTQYTDDGIVRFSEPLTYYVDELDEDVVMATGELIYNEEVEADIYWCWNYEVVDVPDYKSISRFSGLDKKSAIRKYDEEDTLLGNYVDKIWINVYIEGRTEGANG